MSSREELKRFLAVSRARIDPATVGLSINRRRRTRGLTREQVAELAGVSAHWYALFESGAARNVSPGMIDAICRALQLTIAESVYLSRLAGQDRASGTYSSATNSANVAFVRRIVDNYAGPAGVYGPRFDVYAVNRICTACVPLGNTRDGRFPGNLLWNLFMNPASREIFADWRAVAEDRVALFRSSFARHADEAPFHDLVTALLNESAEFGSLWNDMKVRLHNREPITLTVRHPTLGEMRFDSVIVLVEEGGEVMMSFGVPSDADTMAVMRRFKRAS